jgi:glycosyltransferase involved in cell wall biosynthesis
LKILHVVPTYLPATRYGGPIQSVHGLCRALAARGHEVHVYTTNVDGPGVSRVETCRAVDVDGVRVWYFPTALGRRLYRSPAMGVALKGNVASFDVLHIHSVFLWPTTAASRLARRVGVPYLICPRGMLVEDLISRKSGWLKRAWIAAFERYNLAGAASIHLTSSVEAEEFRRFGLAHRQINIVKNGIELPPARISIGDVHCRNVDRPRVLSLGRINWKKGLDRLIRSMAYVPAAELLIAGNDDEGYWPKLQRLVSELGLSDRVAYLGSVSGDAKWDIFRTCDIFVLPSYSENFGMAVLEAMACGKAVVVTPEVGLAPTITALGAGVVVAGEPRTLGATIATLLRDHERRNKMGVAGQKAAVERFSWSAIAEQVTEIYEQFRLEI